MNHALAFNHLLGSIYVNPLDYLELCLDHLPSPLHKENGLFPYRKSGLLLHKKGLIEADVDVSRVRSGCVQPAVSFITLLVDTSVAFFCRASFALSSLDEKSADL